MAIDENSLVLPKGIKENIFQYRFRDFLKKNGKPFSGKPVIEQREVVGASVAAAGTVMRVIEELGCRRDKN